MNGAQRIIAIMSCFLDEIVLEPTGNQLETQLLRNGNPLLCKLYKKVCHESVRQLFQETHRCLYLYYY